MTVGDHVHLLVAFLASAALSCAIAAIVLPKWVEVSPTTSYGLHEGITFVTRTCSDGGTRSGNELENRFKAVQFAMYTGTVLCFLGVCLTIGAYRTIGRCRVCTSVAVTMLLAMVLFVASLAVFGTTMTTWYSCGEGLAGSFASSFYLVCAAAGICALVHVVLAFCFQRGKVLPMTAVPEQINPASVFPATAPPRQLKNTSKVEPRTNVQPDPSSQVYQHASRTLPTEVALPPLIGYEMAPVQAAPHGPALDDEWQYDATSRLYWSGLQQLYLDPNINQYFDPASEQWYNPDTGEWYAA